MRCQGCGVAAGQPMLTWHDKKIGNQWTCYSRNHGVAFVVETDMAGWPRLFCQLCRKHAEDLNFNKQVFGVARPDKSKKKPDERDPGQLSL